MQLEKHYLDEMIAHSQAEAPNECCGVLAGQNGKIVRLYRGLNAEASPFRYNLDPKDLLRIMRDIDVNGWDVLGTYHSHTHTRAYPSATDVKLAFWPDSLYFIISLEDAARPYVKAFHIREGQIEEEKLEVI